ncbi:MAG: DUF4184 family protein [Lacunisphaera sp.]
MPAPLAHPAAVLSLRRFCPKYLSFSALVMGSFLPDVAYALHFGGSFRKLITFVFGQRGLDSLAQHGVRSWDGLSHSLLGAVVFCLPVGLLLSAAFRVTRSALVATVPNPHRELLTPLCGHKRHSVLTWSMSLLIGVYSHLAWDSLAKGDWWLAKNWPFLREDVMDVGASHLEVYRAIWIISTIGGTSALVIAYVSWVRGKGRKFWKFDQEEAPYLSLWLGAALFSILLPVGFFMRHRHVDVSFRGLYYLFHGFYAVSLVVFSCCVVAIALVSMLRRARSVPR